MTLQVIFFGTSQFGIPALEALSENKDIEVKSVITQPDKPAGRKQELTESPVKIFAKFKNLPIIQPENLKNKEFLDFIKNLKLDFIVTASYGKIIPKEILEMPKYVPINIHPSLLPKYRGATPIQEALLKGDTETGVSIMKMNEKMDEGDIILIKKIPVEETDDYVTLEKKLAVLSGILIVPVLKHISENILKPIGQKHEKATYCKKIQKEEGKIRWNEETAEEIKNKIRAFKLWPGTYTEWKGKRIKIHDAYEKIEEKKCPPGAVYCMEGKIEVGTKKNILVITKIQMEGKKEMMVEEFLKGYEKELKKILDLNNTTRRAKPRFARRAKCAF